MPVSCLEHKVIRTLTCLMKNEVFQWYANVISSGHRPPLGKAHFIICSLQLHFAYWKMLQCEVLANISNHVDLLCLASSWNLQNFAVRFSINIATFTIYWMRIDFHTLSISFDFIVPKWNECLFNFYDHFECYSM